MSGDGLIRAAYALEAKSEHPLGRAIALYASKTNPVPDKTDAFEIFPGGGLAAYRAGKQLIGGSVRFVSERLDGKADLCQVEKEADRLSAEGKTPMVFAEDGRILGIISVSDSLREDSTKAVAELKNMGLHVIMLTGDRRATAEAIGKAAGVDEVVAELLPGQKAEAVKKLSASGRKIAMVGDGINDAPALTAADLGIAVGAGTDIAIDSADVVLMGSGLSELPAAIRLGKAALANIHENLFWAFIYNAIGIPLAAGLFGWKLDPMFAAAAMSLSSFCVVTNALRLNVLNIKKEKRIKRKSKGVKIMERTEKTVKIEGMMCGHCEARVKKCLEALPHVLSADVSHEKGQAVLTLDGELPDKAIAKAIEKEGYKVVG